MVGTVPVLVCWMDQLFALEGDLFFGVVAAGLADGEGDAGEGADFEVVEELVGGFVAGFVAKCSRRLKVVAGGGRNWRLWLVKVSGNRVFAAGFFAMMPVDQVARRRRLASCSR